MNILTLNVGSSSIKYALYVNDRIIEQGIVERLRSSKSYDAGFRSVFKAVDTALGKKRLDAIAHRVVHGSRKHCRITKSVLQKLKRARELAPLHQSPEVRGIEWCERFAIPQFAIVDAAFHASMPNVAKAYAIPRRLSAKYGIERFGFHGLSHEYVADYMRKEYPGAKRIVSCHLGSGASITAIRGGKSVDTSMGFTPLEGLPMATRAGDLDPGVLLFLLHHETLSQKEITRLFNEESGLNALCGLTDIRDILKSKKKDAKFAHEYFCYKAAKYIGSYAAVLGGIDALVFAGGIGEHESVTRKRICDYLGFLGVSLNASKNKQNREHISKGKVKVVVLKTDESLMMLKHAKELLRIHHNF